MPTMVDAVEVVRQMEREIKVKKKAIARTIRRERKARKLTLDQVGRAVRRTVGAIHNLETGKSWETRTVLRVARFFEKIAA
jgi:hypothetical protein